MSKPSPFYRSEKERQELVLLRDNFTFYDPEEQSKLVAVIAGREGSGKTHLACTMCEAGPVYLLDTEYRAQIVTRKFKGVKFAPVKSYVELVVAVKHILKHQPPGTIIIDSASDLQTFSEIEYLERSEKERVGMPWNWSEVWRLCNAIIDDIKVSQRFDLVLTARVKEEYAGDKPTGQIIPRIYSTLPYKADVVVQYGTDKERRLQLVKNGYSGDLTVQVGRDMSLPEIVKRLSVPTAVAHEPRVLDGSARMKKAS
jgi:hypothetical protein